MSEPTDMSNPLDNDPLLSTDEVETKDYAAAPVSGKTPPPPPPKKNETPEEVPNESKGSTEEPNEGVKENNDPENYEDIDIEHQFEQDVGETLGSLFAGSSPVGMIAGIYNMTFTPVLANIAVPIKSELRELRDKLEPRVFGYFTEANKKAAETLQFTETETSALEEAWAPVLAEMAVGEVKPIHKALLATGGIAVGKAIAISGLRQDMNAKWEELKQMITQQPTHFATSPTNTEATVQPQEPDKSGNDKPTEKAQ